MRHSLPVQYAESNDELIVVAGFHQHKKWWRNLLSESSVRVCYRRRWVVASARAFDGDAAVIAPLLPAYLRRSPRGYTARSAQTHGGDFGPQWQHCGYRGIAGGGQDGCHGRHQDADIAGFGIRQFIWSFSTSCLRFGIRPSLDTRGSTIPRLNCALAWKGSRTAQEELRRVGPRLSKPQVGQT